MSDRYTVHRPNKNGFKERVASSGGGGGGAGSGGGGGGTIDIQFIVYTQQR
jgi:hypothetical protein